MVCRRTTSATELRRVGRAESGRWCIGPGPGRGAWICRGEECPGQLRASHVARALRQSVDEAAVKNLQQLLLTGIEVVKE